MSMLSYSVLPVFGQKWPIVSGRTSQLGPELHPHQPDMRTDRTRTLCQNNISSHAYDYNPLCQIFSHIFLYCEMSSRNPGSARVLLQTHPTYMQVTSAHCMLIILCVSRLFPNQLTN